MKFQGTRPLSIAIVPVEAFEFNCSGARFRRIGGYLSLSYTRETAALYEMKAGGLSLKVKNGRYRRPPLTAETLRALGAYRPLLK